MWGVDGAGVVVAYYSTLLIQLLYVPKVNIAEKYDHSLY
jgi:hypothetical protein